MTDIAIEAIRRSFPDYPDIADEATPQINELTFDGDVDAYAQKVAEIVKPIAAVRIEALRRKSEQIQREIDRQDSDDAFRSMNESLFGTRH